MPETVCEVCVDFVMQMFGDELLKECLATVANLLSDNVYAARRAAGCLITALYHKWTKPQVYYLPMLVLLVFTHYQCTYAAVRSHQVPVSHLLASKLFTQAFKWCSKESKQGIPWLCMQSVFDDLKQQLSLYSLTHSKTQSEEHMETAILMLGEWP